MDTATPQRQATWPTLSSLLPLFDLFVKEVSNSFINAFEETFEYLGMFYGGYIHANCDDGYQAENYADDLSGFMALFK